MNSENGIGGGRILAGFFCGALVPIGVFAVLLWPSWLPVVALGGLLAVVLFAIFGFPALLLLRYFGLINIYSAAILGGVLCTIPIYYFSIYNATTTHSMKRNDVALIVDSRLTIDGWIHLFVYDPLFFFVPGALGGIVGWLVAAGWRTRAS